MPTSRRIPTSRICIGSTGRFGPSHSLSPTELAVMAARVEETERDVVGLGVVTKWEGGGFVNFAG